jgi:hypothetical protein
MKKIVLSMISMLVWGCVAYAQPAWSIDSVSMGTSSANDVFYSLSAGSATAKVENNKNWHMAFTMNAGDSSGVWANHNSGNAFVKVYNTHKDSTQWAAITWADTLNENLFNNDGGWYQGAFNNKPGVGQFDFGWGKYDPVSHNIIGDSIFIVKANGVFYKVWIKELVSTAMTYTIKVGNMTTMIDTQYVISKQPNYANRLFAYFNLATGLDTNREPAITDWDILFTRYTTDFPGSGPMPNNAVLGVLSNRGVKVAKAYPADVDTAYKNYSNYISNWSTTISGVGYNWKTYDQGTNTWSVEDSTSYFVQDKAGNLWQMTFTAYSGSATGNIKFGKRIVSAVGVNDVHSSLNQYSIFPVPTQTNLNVVMDSKESTEAVVMVFDFMGKVVLSSHVKLNTGLNAYILPIAQLANGNYILSVKGNSININEKVTIQH